MKKRSWLLVALVFAWQMTDHAQSWPELLQHLSFPITEKIARSGLIAWLNPHDKPASLGSTTLTAVPHLRPEPQPLEFGFLFSQLFISWGPRGADSTAEDQFQQFQETQRNRKDWILTLKSSWGESPSTHIQCSTCLETDVHIFIKISHLLTLLSCS